ncbi:M56 family metallopeptidase [Luteolibacter yonseiensis]|uniref:M56 family metallopeptidase n=1 Tax=Luteolibacter yonseiensis TaxID=1144680 RepID=A0A934R155_9BACT|nr:M56 family metallopeptidase [Luteolibacter yonseiensis]MBK1814844.1 M56 family metallopeptidase [Luteolibacter yonseiensis]
MSLPTTYLLNVALHAGILSVFATLLLAFIRLPGRRSFAAISGLLVVGLLPWITALRPSPTPDVSPIIPEAQVAPAPAELPLWTIVTVPVRNEAAAPSEPYSESGAKWELPDFPTTVITLWATGVGIGLGLLALAMMRVMLWKRSLKPLDDSTWDVLRHIVPSGTARTDFIISPATTSPCVIGFLRPRIVIPHFLLDALSSEKLRWAVRHETAHRQAEDSRWMILFAVIRCLNWWNPLVHRLVADWAAVREQLCDLHAASSAGDRADYGEFLIAMARQTDKHPSLAVSMARRLHVRRLKQRIVCLLDSKEEGVTPVGRGFIGISLALSVCAAMSVSVLKVAAEGMPPVSHDTPAGETVPEKTEEPTVEKALQQEPVPAQPDVDESAPPPPPPPPAPARAGGQVKISSNFVFIDSKSLEMGLVRENVTDGGRFSTRSLYSEGQIQLIFRGLERMKGCHIMTSPSVCAKFGQESMIEIIREIAEPPGRVSKRNPDSGDPYVGIKMHNSSEFSEEIPGNEVVPAQAGPSIVMEISQTVDYHYIPGRFQPVVEFVRSKATLPKGISPTDIKTVKRTIKGRLASGFTVCTNLGEVEPGRSLIIFTRMDAIDATGRRLDGLENPSPNYTNWAGSAEPGEPARYPSLHPDEIPSAKVKGRVRISGTQIDLPRDPTLPEDARNFKMLLPSDDEALNALARHYGLEKRRLKQVVIPTAQAHIPWPEFPGINLSVLLSKKFRKITLSNDSEGNGSSVMGMTSGQAAAIDVASGDPSIERRIFITVEIVE